MQSDPAETQRSQEITLSLSEAEFRTLAGLLDAAVRAGGLRAAKDALAITSKMERAYEAAHPDLAMPGGPDPLTKSGGQ